MGYEGGLADADNESRATVKRLRQPRWLFRLIGSLLNRWRGYWWSRCVNCGQEFGAWEWTLDGRPTTGKPGWHYEEFAICRECDTADANELAGRYFWRMRPSLSDWAARQRDKWLFARCPALRTRKVDDNAEGHEAVR